MLCMLRLNTESGLDSIGLSIQMRILTMMRRYYIKLIVESDMSEQATDNLVEAELNTMCHELENNTQSISYRIDSLETLC